MKRFKVLSFMSVFLLLFALGGVASADDATQVIVEISYPCEGGDICDTGVAQSSDECGDSGDVVNVYVSLLDANGNPATAGPNSEELTGLSASLTSQIADVTENTFLQDTVSVDFSGGSAARAYLDYTNADTGIAATGIQDTINVFLTGANPLNGTAQVNVEAEEAEALSVRTCGGDVPAALYEAIGAPCDNDGESVTAGEIVNVTVIADQGCGNFTTAPNLQGRQITVNAYADFDGSGTVGDDPTEETAIATETEPMANGIAEVALTINNAGPDGLLVVFTATAEDTNGETIESTQIDAVIPPGTGDVDTVTMDPDVPDSLLIAEDVLGTGNLIEEVEDDCIFVLDDNEFCAGAGTDVTVVLVDQFMNAVIPSEAVDVTGSLSGVVDDQLSGCENNTIATDAYSFTCNLADADPTLAGPGANSSLIFADTDLSPDQIQVRILPAIGCNELDLQVSTDAVAPIAAGSDVEVTVDSTGGLDVIIEGDDLEITGNGGMILLSSDGCATQTTTLSVPGVADSDGVAPGIQFTIQVCSPATDATEPVCITVKNLDQCGAEATTATCIPDIVQGESANLAVVGLAPDVETESQLDELGEYVGTDPIVIDSYIIADGVTPNLILDTADSCCDLQVWDDFTNVVNCTPAFTCSTDSGFALPITSDGCNVSVTFTSGAVGSTATVTCGVDTDGDDVDDFTRSFQLVNIVAVIPEDGEEPEGIATALQLTKEGPQDVDGGQISPAAGGEAIIQIGANGDFVGEKNVTIDFAPDSVAGGALRKLDGSPAGALPLTVRIAADSVQRYVVYAPAVGVVTVTATDNTPEEPLLGDTLPIGFGTDVCQNEVTVTCGETSLCPDDACTTCTAVTTCGDNTISGTYSWEVNGAVTTANTGNSIEICPADLNDGDNTVAATDTANGDITGSAAVTYNDPDLCGGGGGCTIDVIPDSLLKSHWLALPALFRIETIGFDFGPLGLKKTVTIDCETDGAVLKAILKGLTIVIPPLGSNTTILWQSGIIWPAALTQSLELESETCTYTVDGFTPDGDECTASDTFDLDYLSIFGIPLAE